MGGVLMNNQIENENLVELPPVGTQVPKFLRIFFISSLHSGQQYLSLIYPQKFLGLPSIPFLQLILLQVFRIVCPEPDKVLLGIIPPPPLRLI